MSVRLGRGLRIRLAEPIRVPWPFGFGSSDSFYRKAPRLTTTTQFAHDLRSSAPLR